MPDDEDVRKEETENEESSKEEELTGSESEETEDSEVGIEAEYLSIEGENNLIDRGNINNINISGASTERLRAVLRELGETRRARHIPPSPPADAPLQKRINY